MRHEVMNPVKLREKTPARSQKPKSVGVDRRKMNSSSDQDATKAFGSWSDMDREKLKNLFENFDKDNNGEIDTSEFRHLVIKCCKEFGEAIPSDTALNKILKSSDDDWDGMLGFEEFMNFMNELPILIEIYRFD
jgi:hypothetical protein